MLGNAAGSPVRYAPQGLSRSMNANTVTVGLTFLTSVFMFSLTAELKHEASLTFSLLLVLLNFNSFLSALLIPHLLLPQAFSLLQLVWWIRG